LGTRKLNLITTHSLDQNFASKTSQSLKYDGRLAAFGIRDAMPMRLADMDFVLLKVITKGR
jgi:bifunctional pyridoxal-dependent enzyme with beta-cystathionase and maltose regulon repressor activities